MSKKAILLTVYGASQKEVYDSTIAPFIAETAEEYPDYEVRIAFTSERFVKRAVESGLGEFDTVEKAMAKLAEEGFDEVIVQSTGVLVGGENAEVVAMAKNFADRISCIRIGSPLIEGEKDYCRLIEAIETDLLPLVEKDAALLLMGHGSPGISNGAYSELGLRIRYAGHSNIFVTTLEQFPSVLDTEKDIAHCGFKKILLAPLLMSRGKHTTVDMAGDGEESLKNILISKGYDVTCLVRGLSESPAFRRIIVEHVASAAPVN